MHLPAGLRAAPLQALRACIPFFIAAGLVNPAPAAIGVAVYESKGLDARRTATGHLSLVATQVCAEGLKAVRPCRAGEKPGVIMTRYAGLAWGVDLQTIVVPFEPHWYAVDEYEDVPLLSSGEVLKQAQLKYWREHLQADLPPMSEDEYKQQRAAWQKFNFGREFRSALQFEFLIKLLARNPNQEPTEPIALRDPVTGLLVRNGRWREVFGARQTRDTVVFLTESTVAQELALNEFLRQEHDQPFNAFSSNCSDFVARGLEFSFKDPQFKRRIRALDVADVGVAAPLSVSTDLIRYFKKTGKTYTVSFMPMMPGTRVPTMSPRTIAGGALLPTPTQGTLGFVIRGLLLQMNPLLIAYSQGAEFASRPIHPDYEVTKRVQQAGIWQEGDTGETTPALNTKEIRLSLFGSQPCWESRKTAFRKVVDWAEERQYIPKASSRQALKTGRGYQFARVFEKMGTLNDPKALDMTRREARRRFTEGSLEETTEILPYVLAAVNFDLSAYRLDRRMLPEVESDWALLQMGLRRLNYAALGNLEAPLAGCSNAQFAKSDARSKGHWIEWIQRPAVAFAYGPRK
jgi:hypothetical protein